MESEGLTASTRARLAARLTIMKSFALSCLLLSTLLASGTRAQTTPMDAPLEEQKIITIACQLDKAPTLEDEPLLNPKEPEAIAKSTFHYNLWLPAGYLESPDKRWPCLFILSPSGKANMGNMAGYLKAHNFIVIMLVESKNGWWGPIIGDFLASHDDAVKRLRIREGFKFATGQSGGARASTVLVQSRPGFAGVILQSAGAAYYGADNAYWLPKLKTDRGLYVVMLMGKRDKNLPEVEQMRAEIPADRFHDIEFDGGHVWAPAPVFAQGMDWLGAKLAASAGQ